MARLDTVRWTGQGPPHFVDMEPKSRDEDELCDEEGRAGLEPGSLACGPGSFCAFCVSGRMWHRVWPHERALGFPLHSNMEVYTGALGPVGC